MPGATSADPANLPPRKAEKALAEMDFPTSAELFTSCSSMMKPCTVPEKYPCSTSSLYLTRASMMVSEVLRTFLRNGG